MVEIPDSPLRLRLRVTLKAMMALAVLFVAVISLRYLGGADTAGEARHVRFDVSDMAPGSVRTVGWRGRAVIVLHRSGETVDALGERIDGDPSPDWFVAFARGTASGCSVVWEGQANRFRESCGTASWDAAGEPLPANDAAPLAVPPHFVTADRRLVIGQTRGD